MLRLHNRSWVSVPDARGTDVIALPPRLEPYVLLALWFKLTTDATMQTRRPCLSTLRDGQHRFTYGTSTGRDASGSTHFHFSSVAVRADIGPEFNVPEGVVCYVPIPSQGIWVQPEDQMRLRISDGAEGDVVSQIEMVIDSP